MEGKFAELEVRVHGKAVREFRHKRTTWIEGRKGSDFVLRVRNRSDRRILAVVSVDGLSVMDGEPASKDSSGYVIGAYSFLDIPGWRLDDEKVAKFFFNAMEGSYAAKMGKPTDVGVIGLAVFREKQQNYHRLLRSFDMNNGPYGGFGGSQFIGYSSWGGGTRGSSAGTTHQAPPSTLTVTTCSVSPQDFDTQWQMNETSHTAKGVQQDVGTGFGEETGHAVTYTNFERAGSKPDEVLKVRYDSRTNLKKRGVPMGKRRATVAEPDPFPGDRGCKPPPGWDGRRH